MKNSNSNSSSKEGVCTALDDEIQIKQLVLGRDHVMILAKSTGKEGTTKSGMCVLFRVLSSVLRSW
jgi:hypothetical protein